MAIRDILKRSSNNKPTTSSSAGAPATPAAPAAMKAVGFVPPPKPAPGDLKEFGSSQPVQIIEQVPELSSPYTRMLTYARMMNDAGVDVSMRAVKTPVLGADFFMDAYSSDQIDVDAADFCWDNLAGGMNAPLLNSLEDILHFFEDGYAILEKVYGLGNWSANRSSANTRQFTMLEKLAVRPPSTISGIEYDDNGGPKTITHNAVRADRTVDTVEIDISKLCVFTFGRRGGDLTGKSLLRTAYPHWYYKTHFYKIDAIQKERNSLGVPKGKLSAGYTEADKIALRTLLQNLRSNEEAFMMLPPNVDVEFAEVKSNPVNVLDSALHHNSMIMLNVMGQFLVLGMGMSGSGGGRATSGSMSDMFMKSLKFVANLICEIVNMFIIPELVVWNFPTTNFPTLKVRNIGETRDLQMFGAALANILAQDGITMDDDTEQWIREVFDMPAKRTPRTPAVEIPTRETITVKSDSADPGSPVVPLENGNAPSPQKGNVKTPGAGNVGKPPNSFS